MRTQKLAQKKMNVWVCVDMPSNEIMICKTKRSTTKWANKI